MRFQKSIFWLTFTAAMALASNSLAETKTGLSAAANEITSSPAINWIVGLLAAIVALLGTGLFMYWRKGARIPFLPPRLLVLPPMRTMTRPVEQVLTVQKLLVLQPPTISPVETAETETWKQRALTAEAMAGKQGEILREKMIPELTEFAKQSLVQGLVTQRNLLLETQRKAQQALLELESRMSVLQTPLQERIRVYETRIAELEQAVQTQGEEVRELTRATLALVRTKLAEERGNQQLHPQFN